MRVLHRSVLFMGVTAFVAAACGRMESGARNGNGSIPVPHFHGLPSSDSPDGTPTPSPTETSPDGTPTPSPTPTETSPDGTPTPSPTPTAAPCDDLVLEMSNTGVSSAEVVLNGSTLVSPSHFPDATTITMAIAPISGWNELDAKLNGSPTDVLHLVVRTADSSVVYVDETLVRSNGKPHWIGASFFVPDCSNDAALQRHDWR